MAMQKFTKVAKRARPKKETLQFSVLVSEANEEVIYKALSKSLPSRGSFKLISLIAVIETKSDGIEDAGTK